MKFDPKYKIFIQLHVIAFEFFFHKMAILFSVKSKTNICMKCSSTASWPFTSVRIWSTLFYLFIFIFQEEDEENVKGVFYNEMYNLELDKGTWHQIFLR